MKTKLVYCLISQTDDIYLEEALVSMYSARLYNEDIHITLVTDNKTKNTFKNTREEILKYVNELIVIDLPDHYTIKQKSRLLKLSIRNVIAGDFLYIDTDTIIADSLSELDHTSLNFAAVRDIHFNWKDYPAKKGIKNFFDVMGQPMGDIAEYFNSGVIYAKDTPQNRTFYLKWKNNYLRNIHNGIDLDQPNFALTNIQMNHFIERLPDQYNCQIRVGYVPGAKIIHYFNVSMGGAESKDIPFLNTSFYFNLKHDHIISPDIKKLIQNRIPILAACSQKVWYHSPALPILHEWICSDQPIIRLQYHLFQFCIRAVNKCEKILGIIKNN